MKSTSAIIAALASTAIAQPHAHNHGHLHPARMEHQHLHNKRVLETETIVEWVTETVIEMIEGTTTEWVTEGATAAPTTLSTVIATTTSEAGQFFETASKSKATSTTTTPAAVAEPVKPTTSSTSVEVAETTATTSSSAYVAPVEPTPSTTTTEAPAVVEPTPTTTTTSAAAAATTTASSSSSGTISGTDFSGKLTWIGDTTGAYSACGQPYEKDSMFVAVNPNVLDCGTDGKGTPMSITANGKTVSAVAIDKCMGCPTDHIDVASAVWTALGYTFDDGGMHDNPGLKWVLSSTK